MNNLRVKLGCHISNKNIDKHHWGGGESPPSTECFKRHRSDRVNQTSLPISINILGDPKKVTRHNPLQTNKQEADGNAADVVLWLVN